MEDTANETASDAQELKERKGVLTKEAAELAKRIWGEARETAK